MTVAQTTTEAAILRGVRKGDRGPIVVSIRTLLGKAGFPSAYGPADPSLFDVQLDQLVRGFQQVRRLQVDGIVGPKTWAALSGQLVVQPSPPVAVPETSLVTLGAGAGNLPPPAQTEPSGLTKLLGLAAVGVAGYFAVKKFAPDLLKGGNAAPALAGYGAPEDLSEQEQEIYVKLLAERAKARGRRRVTHPGMTDEQKKAAQLARAAEMRAEKAEVERLARIYAARRDRTTEQAEADREFESRVQELVKKGTPRWDAETEVRRTMFLPGGPTTSGERAAAITKRNLIEQASELINPTINEVSPGVFEARIDYVDLAGQRHTRDVTGPIGTVRGAIASERSKLAERLLRSGYGPVSLPSAPKARVKPSVMRRAQDVFPLSPTDALIRAQGTSPETYPMPDVMTPEARAKLIALRAEEAEERRARAAAIEAPRYDPSMRKGDVLVIEVDAARYDTNSPAYDKAYRIAKNDEAIAAARKAMLPVQIRAAAHSISRDTPLVLPGGAIGPSVVDPAHVRHMLRVRPDRDPGQEGQATARGGETKFYPSGVLQRQMGPEASSHRILFAWDPRKAKARKLDGLGDLVTNARINEAAVLARKGDCEKAVPHLFRVRGLVQTPSERTLLRRVVRDVNNKCRDELESAVAEAVMMRGRHAQQTVYLDPDPAKRELVVGRGPGRERSGAQKRAKLRPLNPDRPWGPIEAGRGLAPLLTAAEEAAEEGQRTIEEQVFGPAWRPSSRAWPVDVRTLGPSASRGRAASVSVTGPVYALPRPVELPRLTASDPWQRRLKEKDIERLVAAAALAPAKRGPEYVGGRVRAKEVVVPADGSPPYYTVMESKGKGRKPAPKKREITPEAMRSLGPPIAVTVRKKSGDKVYRFAAAPF